MLDLFDFSSRLQPNCPAVIGDAAFNDRASQQRLDRDGPIPAKYTADGQDIFPPLFWSSLPPKTVSLALILDDPDAEGPAPFCHWIIANLPTTLTSLPDAAGFLPSNLTAGRNDFGRLGYDGPDPSAGKVHHYHFHLFALDAMLNFPTPPARGDLFNAMNGHMLAQGELVATYQR